jgi:hypothetical protein
MGKSSKNAGNARYSFGPDGPGLSRNSLSGVTEIRDDRCFWEIDKFGGFARFLKRLAGLKFDGTRRTKDLVRSLVGGGRKCDFAVDLASSSAEPIRFDKTKSTPVKRCSRVISTISQFVIYADYGAEARA